MFPFDKSDGHFSQPGVENGSAPTEDVANGSNETASTNVGFPSDKNSNAQEALLKPATNGELSRRARRGRKKRQMKPAAPATTVTRGFETPVASGGEESDFSAASTPRFGPLPRPPVSVNGSPGLRPSGLTRAMSNLKLHPSALEMERSTSRSSQGSSPSDRDTQDIEPMDMENGTYEIPLSRDFASPDARPRRLLGAIEGGLRTDSPHRKMTATDFEPLKCLGKGAYGTVLLVKQHSTGRLFAQKQLKKASLTVQRRLVEQTKTERAILESVNRHPFVVKLFYAFQDQQKLYLILEYAQGGELFHHLAMERMFTEDVAAFYMAEMVLALDHLHRNLGVVYRDLKPENCLLDAEGHLLLTDFGLSKVAVDDPSGEGGGSKCSSILGTIDYMAPEVVKGVSYDSAVDWWSLGALGYDLLTGSPPFASNNYSKTQQKILHGKLSLPYYLSPDSRDLLTRLLRKEPKKRLGGNMPKDLATLKSHRFFRRIDWTAMQKRELIAPIQPIVTDPAAAENFSSEFTDLPMSPVDGEVLVRSQMSNGVSTLAKSDAPDVGGGEDVFGGFSFVASRSLLECGEFLP